MQETGSALSFTFAEPPPRLPYHDGYGRAFVESGSNNFFWLRGINAADEQVLLADVLKGAHRLAYSQAIFRGRAGVTTGLIMMGCIIGHYWSQKRVWLISSLPLTCATALLGSSSYRASRAMIALCLWRPLGCRDGTTAERYNQITEYVAFEQDGQGSCTFGVKPEYLAGLQQLGSLLRLPGDGWLRWMYLHRACALLAQDSYTKDTPDLLCEDPLASKSNPGKKDRQEVLKVVRQARSVLSACEGDFESNVQNVLCIPRVRDECARWRKSNWVLRLWRQPGTDWQKDLTNDRDLHEDFNTYIAILNWANKEFGLNLSPIAAI
jgi:hypothetical protein